MTGDFPWPRRVKVGSDTGKTIFFGGVRITSIAVLSKQSSVFAQTQLGTVAYGP